MTYSITEVVEHSGASADTLRYYEKIGLIDPPSRDTAGRRTYTERDVLWIAFLLRLRGTGMPIRLMQEYADLRRLGDTTARRRRDILVDHRAEIRSRMDELRSVLDVLDRKITDYDKNLAGDTVAINEPTVDSQEELV
ncbi:MerR family transcriptional regulator [Kribbella sp. NPDC003505]|uniref:MerR family transcriptional regulator n=1 Tax=Kribbella sp. NPDC003505 TaxID=3154448 RepID=UPI0033BD138C